MKTIITLSFCFTLLVNTSVYAEAITDGSLGDSVNLSGAMQIPQSLGTTRGNNLFHSFSRFNINTNESATFTGSNTLSNVVSRVTGGQVSNIDGTLKSTIGNANFYFINPAGVTFGANAQVDVPAAFHVSTADTLRFSDGSQFSATDSSASSLSVAEPTGFGFLNPQGGNIEVHDSTLNFHEGRSVSLSGHHVAINNGRLIVPSGNIQVYGTGGVSTELPLNTPVTQVLTGRVELNAGSQLDTSTNSGGHAGGKINLQGGDILVNNSSVTSDTVNSDSVAKLSIKANRLSVSNGGQISSSTSGTGHAGGIEINAGEISVDGHDDNNQPSVIVSNTYNTGRAGTVSIRGNRLSVSNTGQISSGTYGTGDANNVAIDVDNILVDGQGNNAWISSNSNNDVIANAGNAGTVSIKANNLSVLNTGQISSGTYGTGNANNVAIDVDNILVDGQGNNAWIASSSNNTVIANAGHAGTISIKGNHLNVLNTGQISSATWGSGNASHIAIEVDHILVDGQGNETSIASSSYNDVMANAGHAGTVSIKTNNLDVSNGGYVSSNTRGSGNAGNLFIDSDNLNINDGSISSDTSGTGNAGIIHIDSSRSVLNGGHISSGTNNSGNAGSVSLNGDSLSLFNGGYISSDTSSLGNAGAISIDSNRSVLDGGHISSSTNSLGNAGSVSLKSDSLSLFNDGYISSETTSLGNAGTINIDSGHSVLDGGHISSAASSSGNAGSVIFKGDSLSLLNSGYISSNTAELGNAGIISIDSGYLVVDGGEISSDTLEGSGNAGSVFVNSNSLNVLNGGKISSDTWGSGNAGAISIESASTVLNGGKISSDTLASGNAGSVSIIGDHLSVLNGGRISSDTWSSGLAGAINIAATSSVIDGGLISSNTFLGSGNAGNVSIQGDHVSVLNGGKISSDTYISASGNAGDIFITANNLSVDQAGSITSNNTNGNGGDINLNVKHLTLTAGGAVSTTTYGLGNAGTIAVQNAEDVVIDGVDENFSWTLNNGRQITGLFSGFYLNTQGAGNGGNLQLNTKRLTLSDGGAISAIAVDGDTKNTANTSAGSILINADQVDLNGGGLIATTTSSLANAGSVTVNAKDALTISGQFDHTIHPRVNNPRESDHSAILSNASHILNPNADQLGAGGSVSLNTANLFLSDGGLVSVSTEGDKKAGVINLNVGNTLTARNGAAVSSSTSGAGSAGNVNIIAPVIALDNASISAEASSSSQGQTGNVSVTANQAIYLSNHASISLKNDANISNTDAIIPSSITVSAPDIDLKNSKITTEATGNVDAGDININFTHNLTMDPAFITTAANTGNGGDITIKGGQLIYLQNSGFLTSVSGKESNGGNINVKAEHLVMDTGVIQANAVGGSGGDIDLNLKALIPSQNRLIIGGRKVAWHPFVSGLNVIQAASENGISGAVNVTSPQFDISASVSGLDSSQLVMPEIDSNLCQSSAMLASSLSRGGQGGIPIDEARYGFIPPTTTELNSSAITTPLTHRSTPSEKSYPCTSLQP